MHVFGKKKKVQGDEATQYLMKHGAYSPTPHPHPFVFSHEEVKAKKIYNFWSGVKYTIILSILLFWIPPFGQMVAGYVGGRKAGTPVKGMLAAMVPVVTLFIIFGLSKLGLFTEQIDWLFQLPEMGASALTGVPVIGPVAEFSVYYIRTFVQSVGFSGNWMSPYFLTVVFGHVGGIMSLLHQREMAVEHQQGIALAAGGTTTGGGAVAVPVHPQTTAPPEPQQEEIPRVMGKKPDGWEEEK